MEKVIEGKADLAYELAIDVMPDFTPVDPTSLSLSRPVYEPTKAEVDEAIDEFAVALLSAVLAAAAAFSFTRHFFFPSLARRLGSLRRSLRG